MSYVSKARECLSRWRHERYEAKAGKLHVGTPNGCAPALAGGAKGHAAATGEPLEIRGIGLAISPKVIRPAGRL